MNPLLKSFLESILKKALTSAAAVLVAWGWIAQDDSEKYVLGLIAYLLSVGWSAWTDYKDRLKLMVAQALPGGVTEKTVEQVVRSGAAPSSLTHKDDVPQLTKPKEK